MKKINEATIEKLLAEARDARKFSYAPYSHLRIGAAVLGKNGAIFKGCNIENMSYGVVMCAERVAIFNAISSGVQEIEALAISCEDEELSYPCGACRQVISEFSKDALIIIGAERGEYITESIEKLLPQGFFSHKLKSPKDC